MQDMRVNSYPMASWFYHPRWVVPKSSVHYTSKMFKVTFDSSMFATASSQQRLRGNEKVPLRACAGSATVTSPAKPNTDLGREGGGSVITHNSMGRRNELQESYCK